MGMSSAPRGDAATFRDTERWIDGERRSVVRRRKNYLPVAAFGLGGTVVICANW
jgi:hypothetical protein